MQVISWSAARDQGLKHYFTGRPCKRGHIAHRFVSGVACSACLQEQKDARRDGPKRVVMTKEQRRQRRRDYYLANSDRLKAGASRWRSENKVKVRAYSSNRRARLRKVDGSHCEDDIIQILRLQKGRCAYCRVAIRKRYDVDHIVPINKGGANDRRNLQVLCRPCNRWKSDADPLDFSRKTGRLL